MIASTLDKIATEIRHLQRTEVREAEEFFSEKQKGSSAMPHKRNPVTCEQISGLARVVRSQRAGWIRERRALARARHLALVGRARHHSRLDHARSTTCCNKTANLIDTMFVYPERMKRNLESTAAWSSADSCCSIWSSMASRAKTRIDWCSSTPCAPGKKI